MREFMLLIRNSIDHQHSWTSEQHQEFLNKCKNYIAVLKSEGRLISAQPLVREGTLLTLSGGRWVDIPFNEAKEVIVGYYHVYAEDVDDAMEIAKGNPEFQYGSSARVEVRPVKMKEEKTGFVYPAKR
ncbi:MAG TPA: YciI family protein [Bacteroidota bacterium]|nr:YciI family protein [Bacteroidota bacterium]